MKLEASRPETLRAIVDSIVRIGRIAKWRISLRRPKRMSAGKQFICEFFTKVDLNALIEMAVRD